MDKEKDPMEMTAEEKLEATMGGLYDRSEKNIKLDPLDKRLKGKENKKFEEPVKAPKDLSKSVGSDSIKNATKPNLSTQKEMIDPGAGLYDPEEDTREDDEMDALNRGEELEESMIAPQAKAIPFILSKVPMISQIIGEKFYGSGIPISFIREGKNFSGIFLFADQYHLLMEFVIEEGGDRLVSASKFGRDLVSEQAEFTVIFSKESFEENIRELAIILNGSHGVEDPAIIEESKLRESKKDDVMAFLKSVDTNLPISTLLRDYNNWADKNDASTVSEAYFRNVVKSLGGDDASQASTQTASGAQIAHYQDTFETPPEYDEFEKEIMQNDVFYKYEMMGEIVKAIVEKNPMYKNVFIYGVGGIGKTYTVEQVIAKYGNSDEVITYKGAIAGFTGLLQVLWENRDDKILVFDDNDGILASGNINAGNLLKGAMEMSDPRILTYSRFKRKKESLEDYIEDLVEDGYDREYAEEVAASNYDPMNESSMSDLDLKNKEGEELTDEEQAVVDASLDEGYHTMTLSDVLGNKLLEAEFDEDGDEIPEDDFDPRESLSDLAKLDADQSGFDKEAFASTYQGSLDPDLDPAFGLGPDDEIPDRFQFNSRVIFISNLLQIPQPLMDRTYTVGLLLTKEQILDLIDSKLGNLMAKYPQVTLEDKKEVLKFMRTYLHRAGKTPTFRGFEQLVALSKSDHPDAKKLMYLAYTAGGGMKMPIR